MIMPILVVSDVDASVAFYTEKLGFVNGGVMKGADGKGSMGFLSLHDNNFGVSKGEVEGTPANGLDLMIYVEGDIDTYYSEVTGRGVTPKTDIKTEYWGDRMFSVQDPDGFVLTFAKTVKQVPMEEIEAQLREE